MTCEKIVNALRVDDRHLMSVYELIIRCYKDRYVLNEAEYTLTDWNGKVIEIEDPENINEDY